MERQPETCAADSPRRPRSGGRTHTRCAPAGPSPKTQQALPRPAAALAIPLRPGPEAQRACRPAPAAACGHCLRAASGSARTRDPGSSRGRRGVPTREYRPRVPANRSKAPPVTQPMEERILLAPPLRFSSFLQSCLFSSLEYNPCGQGQWLTQGGGISATRTHLRTHPPIPGFA